jgi:hypothetical protein
MSDEDETGPKKQAREGRAARMDRVKQEGAGCSSFGGVV